MAETSRSRVTITLGRGGQVVEREGLVLNSGFSDSRPVAGSKRSIRDRLGSDFDGTQLNSKRQRDGSKSSTGAANGVDDARLGKDDLRFKLMRKNGFRRGHDDVQQNKVDLRSTLSRTGQLSTSNRMDTWQRMPESKDAGKHISDFKDVSISGRIPSTRSADFLPPTDSLKHPYSSWTFDQLRRRSPDRGLGSSRGFSPQMHDEELRRRPLMRTSDDVRTVSYMRSDVLEPSRPLSSAPFLSKPAVPAGAAKPAAQLLTLPPLPTGIVQKSPYTVDEHLSVESLLRSLGLEKYAILFQAEEVDMTALRQMGDNDLKELGVPMGPRKKILLALMPRSKRQL